MITFVDELKRDGISMIKKKKRKNEADYYYSIAERKKEEEKSGSLYRLIFRTEANIIIPC